MKTTTIVTFCLTASLFAAVGFTNRMAAGTQAVQEHSVATDAYDLRMARHDGPKRATPARSLGGVHREPWGLSRLQRAG